MVVLLVRDNGLGISEADQEQVFTEFFRSNNPEALHQPGTGLGLAIVQRTVQRHGGTIAVSSELGKGTTFRSEEHTSELQSLMRISYAVFCLKKKKKQKPDLHSHITNTIILNNH